MPYLSGKWFYNPHSKICKKLKTALLKRSEHSELSSRQLQNHFIRSFLWPNFDLSTFEHFALLSRKMVSTSSLKNLQKHWNSFETLRTFVLELKLASKPFSNKLPMTKFWLKYFWTLYHISPENGFNFVGQEFAKIWKMPFSKAQNISTWAQGSFKTIF